MLFPVVDEAVQRSGLTRKDIGFTCSGSADYLAGQSFAFVGNLEVAGAWPPISESHVEMDGAWALYEAWVRLQHGDIDAALVFGSGISSRGNLREVLCLQNDPYYLMPLWADHVSLAALQARAVLEARGLDERALAEVASRSRRSAQDNPHAQVSGDASADDLLGDPYVVAPLRTSDCPPISDGAAAMVLVAGDRAKDVCDRPAWIRGIDHRAEPHYPGVRDLTISASTRLAGEQAGVGTAPIEVAELSATFSHEELLLRDALGLGDDVEVNPSGGALASNPVMATGLTRIGEAARQIHAGKSRTLGHATSGPCLQQNLVCVLEAG
jgi:acetyl-CoA acetyltransferase